MKASFDNFEIPVRVAGQTLHGRPPTSLVLEERLSCLFLSLHKLVLPCFFLSLFPHKIYDKLPALKLIFLVKLVIS